MPRHEVAQELDVDSSSGSMSTISVLSRAAVQVEDVGDAAGHAGREVAAGRAEHHHPPAGHVLAAVVADALDDGGGTGVADAEPLADDAAQEHLAGGRAVQDHVAGDDLLLGRRTAPSGGGRDDDAPAGQALAEVVVGVAGQPQRDAPRHERAERLPGRAGEVHVDRVVGQPLAAPAPGHLVAEHRADGAVDVADRHLQPDRAAVGERALGQLDQRVVERPVQAVVLAVTGACAGRRRRRSGTCSIGVRSSPAAFQCVDRRRGVEQLGVADRLLERAEARARPGTRAPPRR